MADGLSKKQIAARLHPHPRNVALHIAGLKDFFDHGKFLKPPAIVV